MPTDRALCGKARCGCVYWAEQGIPCPHDLEHAKQHGAITEEDYQGRMTRLWGRVMPELGML